MGTHLEEFIPLILAGRLYAGKMGSPSRGYEVLEGSVVLHCLSCFFGFQCVTLNCS